MLPPDLSSHKGKKKYYAVRTGRQAGIFESWDECKKQVIGFPGAEYKSFLSPDDANEYISCQESESRTGKSEAIAYVDGSYNIKTKEFSYGVVLFHNGDEQHFFEKFDDAGLASMRNVAGEIKGSEFAIQFCLDKGIKSVDIYHDYDGIAKWPNGEWKTNKEGTIAYKSFCDNAKKNILINFIKVKGHSGDKYNDLADKLAKEALGL